MNILIIRFSSMGDVILATPVFSYLKSNYPLCRIYFITDARYAELFNNDPRLYQVIGVDKQGGAIEQIGTLRTITWDRIVDLQNNRRSRRLRKTLSSEIPVNVIAKKHFKRILLLFLRINRYSSSDHIVRRYINAVENTTDTLPAYPSSKIFIDTDLAYSLINRLVPDGMQKPLMALIPFSAWRNKEWNRENFIRVGHYFATRGFRIILLGGKEDEGRAQAMADAIGQGCSNLTGQLSLYECACILSGCALALGNDTGLSHLARACGVKTGMLFGATTGHFGFFPTGAPLFRIFQAEVFCRPCHPHGGDFCWRGSRPCLRRIAPDVVCRGMETLYALSDDTRFTR